MLRAVAGAPITALGMVPAAQMAAQGVVADDGPPAGPLTVVAPALAAPPIAATAAADGVTDRHHVTARRPERRAWRDMAVQDAIVGVARAVVS